MKTNDELHEAIIDVRENVVGLRDDFVDLKRHVNEELEVQKVALSTKAEKADLTLFVLWRQSPTWLKIAGAATTAGIAAASFFARFVG